MTAEQFQHYLAALESQNSLMRRLLISIQKEINKAPHDPDTLIRIDKLLDSVDIDT